MKRRDSLRISLTVPAVALVPSLANTKPTETLHEQMLDAVQKTFIEPKETVLDIEILGRPIVQNAPIVWNPGAKSATVTGYVPSLEDFEFEAQDFICKDDIIFRIYEVGEAKVLLATFNLQLPLKCIQPMDTIRFAQNVNLSLS